MDRLVVDADQRITREAVNEGRGRTRAVAPHHLATHCGKLLSADARAYDAPHSNDREVNDLPNLLQPGKIFVVFD